MEGERSGGTNVIYLQFEVSLRSTRKVNGVRYGGGIYVFTPEQLLPTTV